MQKAEAEVKKIREDIKSITIQGATNVAIATLKGIKLIASKYKAKDLPDLIKEVEKAGFSLSEARENEPLATNGVRYVLGKLKDFSGLTEAREAISSAADEYLVLIKESKQKIIENGVQLLKGTNVILTHCHSSTATATLIGVSKENPKLQVVATETRPLYQGRKTAKELVDAKVNVTQIVDDAAPSFIEDDRYLPVESVLVGCDELLRDGSFINKVGTYSMALSAKVGKDEFYVTTTLLKMNMYKEPKFPEIEMRAAREIWEDAPKGLKIINPAFEVVGPEFVTGYITEDGVLKADELKENALKLYPWLKQ